jgi:pimeloyl-ACP methyl ester carboxylesterase
MNAGAGGNEHRSARPDGPATGSARRWLGLVGAGVGALAVGAVTQRAVDASVARLPLPGDLVPVDGRLVHVEPLGAPGGVTVVAETGLGGTAADWERTAERLGPGVRLLAVDRPGLGRSQPGNPPDVAGTARRLEAVLDHAGVEPPVVLAGWSLGALLDLGVAIVRPDLVQGLALVDPSHPDEARRFHDPALTGIGRAALAAMALGARFGGAALAGVPSRMAYLRTATRDGREPLWQIPSFATSASGRALAGELSTFPAVCDELGRLRSRQARRPAIPTVLLSATRRSSRSEARAWEEMHADLAGWIPGTEHVRVEHSGHHMLQDRPDRVAAAIEQVVAAAVSSGG